MEGGEAAKIALIVAVAENGVIGRGGDLPWRLSSDLKLFRRVTMGKPLIMGRRTFESLKGPMPGRDNIVVTRDATFSAEGAIIAHAFDEALACARQLAGERGVDELFVIGGAEIFQQAIRLADRIYLTRVHASPQGDTVFPQIAWSAWREISAQSYPTGPKDAFAFTFFVLERL